MFVDTRFHISVRPTLEYRLPALGHLLRAGVLGDEPDVSAALEEFATHFLLTSAPVTAMAKPRAADEAPALWSACQQVCFLAQEHLTHLSTAWEDHLRHLSLQVGHVVDEVTHATHDAARIRDRYRTQVRASIVECEYTRELNRLRALLTQRLQPLRDRAPPDVPRTSALHEATQQLRRAFSDAHGTLPTAILAELHAAFDEHLYAVQAPIVRIFVDSMTRMLKLRPIPWLSDASYTDLLRPVATTSAGA